MRQLHVELHIRCCLPISWLFVLQAPCLPKGLVRPFQILNVPANPGGTPLGPLLSARRCDLDVVWQRASQLCDVSMQVCVCVLQRLRLACDLCLNMALPLCSIRKTSWSPLRVPTVEACCHA